MDKLDIRNVPLDDEKTWDLISNGHTKGCFQIESNLGKSWCRKIKPRTIEELAVLTAVIRPGCLKSKLNNKSMTQHYTDRKNGKDPVPEYNPVVDKILEETYGTIVFQENSLNLAVKIAGFNPQEADMLRKAIGKKIPEEMTKLKSKFIDGAKELGIVTEEQSEELFGWIEKSQRYAFCKAHAVSYAFGGYWCAYYKTHYPVLFFTTWLNYAKLKPKKYDEIRELIEDAKFIELQIHGPDLRRLNVNFETDGTQVWYGLSDIKGIGETSIEKLKSDQTIIMDVEPKWIDFLIFKTDLVNSRVVKALICSGALDHFGLYRSQMLYEYEKFRLLIPNTEKKWVQKNRVLNESFIDVLERLAPTKKNGGGTSNINRSEIVASIVQLLKTPNQKIEDDPKWIIEQEHNLLGIPMTYSRVGTRNTIAATHTCKNILEGAQAEYIILGVEIQIIRYHTIQQGKNKGTEMAFLTISDDSGAVDSVIAFASILEEYHDMLYEDNVVLMRVSTSSKGGLIIKKIWKT